MIAEARTAAGRRYVEQRDRAQADREFSDIAVALERGLRTVDLRGGSEVLEPLREDLSASPERRYRRPGGVPATSRHR